MKLAILTLATAIVIPITAQPPPPGGAEELRHRLSRLNPKSRAARTIASLAAYYCTRGEKARPASPFAADRYLASAGALLHAAEHQQHITLETGPEPPGSPAVSRQLDRVYFQLKQADFFVKQSMDTRAQTVAALARQFYQNALRALDRRDARVAGEEARTADELLRALENLAQAAAPAPPRP